MKSLESRYHFFREHAGGVVGESAACAWLLARAEESAETLGLVCRWENEDEPWDGECEAPALLLCGAVYRPEQINRDGSVKRRISPLASLGMVGVDAYGDPFLRVCAAEMFAEALDVIDGECQKEADRLAERATFAAEGFAL